MKLERHKFPPKRRNKLTIIRGVITSEQNVNNYVLNYILEASL
jgi:hypothetical protein